MKYFPFNYSKPTFQTKKDYFWHIQLFVITELRTDSASCFFLHSVEQYSNMKQDSPISSYYYLILSVPDIQTVDATVVACAQLCPRYPNSWRHSFRVCPALPQISKQLTRQFSRVPSSAPDIQTVELWLCPRYPNSFEKMTTSLTCCHYTKTKQQVRP